MQPTSSKKEIWTMGSYSLLTLSIMVGFMYINAFGTEVLLIPPATLATALLVGRVIDFVVSLFAGAIIEKVKISNKGKNQSWLYVGRWILVITIMGEVVNTSAAPMIVRLAVLTISYAILNSLMNIIQTAYYGLVAVVGGANPANRGAMMVNMSRQSTVVTMVTSFIPFLATNLPFGSWNYFVIAVIFMLPMPWALGKIADCAEGKDMPVDTNSTGAGGVGVKDMVNTVAQNPQLLVLFLAFTILYIGQFTYQANTAYYWMYVAGNFSLMTVASLVSAVVGFVAAIVMPPIGAKLGKKNATSFGFLVFGIGLIVVSYIARINWIWNVIGMAVTMFATYTYMPYVATLFLDCGEYYLWKTGKDTRAIAAGIASPPMKIGMALGGSLGGYLLASTGFVAGGAFDVTKEWIGKFMNVTFMIPGFIYIAAGLVMLFLYKITDADAAKYAQENAERAAQAAQQ